MQEVIRLSRASRYDQDRPHRRRRRRIPLFMKLLALIGAIAVVVVLGRTVIVPLLVYLNTLGLGGGA